MIRSMTGYGDAVRVTPAGVLRAEIRTVNHRYFSANLRLARPVERYEAQIREWLRALLPRGHVNFALRLQREDGGGSEGVQLRVDEARARQYVDALRRLQHVLGVPGEVDLSLLSRFGELIVPDDEAAEEVALESVHDVTDEAARAVVVMREVEGERLAEDLEGRLRGIEAALVQIVADAPARLVAERDRMRRVVSELLEGIPVDEERVAREIAFLAERWDISEEMVRLRSHLALFRETVAGLATEPVGKRLSFLIQEMNRETNTIGSKANDAAIEHQVIAIKDEIERLREQVENVE